MDQLVIRPFETDADAELFRSLNGQWIAEHFALEDEDRRQLDDPVGAYIEPGGQILIADWDGEPVGCVALAPDGSGAYELSKMAVAPAMSGRGIGRRLIEESIAYARALGATSLFLGSNTKLASAVHLYEQAGFTHVDPASLHMPYERANVFMELRLRSG